MKDPMKWFEEAINSKKYEEEVLIKVKSCISEDGFSIDEFMEWVSEQLEKDIGKD